MPHTSVLETPLRVSPIKVFVGLVFGTALVTALVMRWTGLESGATFAVALSVITGVATVFAALVTLMMRTDERDERR